MLNHYNTQYHFFYFCYFFQDNAGGRILPDEKLYENATGGILPFEKLYDNASLGIPRNEKLYEKRPNLQSFLSCGVAAKIQQ